MITTILTHKQLTEEKGQGYVVFCPKGDITQNPIAMSLATFYPALKTIIEERKFKGAVGSSLVVAGMRDERPVYVMLYGLGDAGKMQLHERYEKFRRAVGSMIRSAEGLKIRELVVQLPDLGAFDDQAFKVAQELVQTADISSYHYDEFLTDESRKHNQDYTLAIVTPDYCKNECQAGVDRAKRVGYAVNQARLWVDLPANILNPTNFAERTAAIARTHGLKISIFDKADIIRMGMGGIHAVSKGSSEEPRFIVLEYHCGDDSAPTIGLVGKGITFDTGGLSLKPRSGMETMKDDMAGAAAVVSTLEAIAHLKPKVNVIGAAALAENMPSGTATRPGDIIKFYNGKTAEVKDTDAEGRLVLADALSYVVKHYKLDAVIDIATLTGMCAYTFGPFYTGLMTKREDLSQKLIDASKLSGDRVWPLPLDDDYKPAIRCEIADLVNLGSEKYRAGTITAAFFLEAFVGETPWAHLDIAGTAFNVPDMSYYHAHGATGAGVRLLVELVSEWARK